MKLSTSERFLALMIADIGKATAQSGEFDYDFISNAISSEYDWAIPMRYSSLFEEEPLPSKVQDVIDILEAWDQVEYHYSELSEEDKAAFVERFPYLKTGPVFEGFDGNNESEYRGIARFFVEDLGRWSSFNGRSLNSHSRSIDRHREISRRYKEVSRRVYDTTMSFDLSLADIIEIMDRP